MEPKEPYLDMQHRPRGKWFGEKPPRRSPDNPSCKQCGNNENVEIAQYAVVDTDAQFHPAVYRCLGCDTDF